MSKDITNVIYLNGVECTLLKEQGVNLESLTWDKLGSVLNSSDCYKIKCVSSEVIGFLSKLGLKIKDSIQRELTKNNTNIEPPLGFIMNAVYSIDDTIIIWPEKSEYSNVHDMYKCSRINILKALTKVMIFKELKQTEIFKATFLAEGI